MRKLIALLFFAVTCAVTVNAQSIRGLMPGPYAERDARQAYAPADRIIGAIGPGGYYDGGFGYDYGGYYGNGRSVITGIAGFVGGYAVGRLTAPRDRREYVQTSDGGRGYYAPQGREVRWPAESKPQKRLDCSKPHGKRGKNEAACLEVEIARANQALEENNQKALAASPLRLYNRSGFLAKVFDGERELGRMRVNQTWRVLEPVTGYRAVLLAPDFSGGITEHEARIRPSSDFQGWVITSPRVEEE